MQAADNSEGDGSLEAIGRAQSNGPVTDIQRIGVTEPGRLRRLTTLQPNQRQIRDWITPDHNTIALIAVGQGDIDLLHLLHNVGIGEHQPLPVDHNSGTLTTLTLRSIAGLSEQIPQQRVDQIGIKGLALHDPLRIDSDHCRSNVAHCICHKTVSAGKCIGCKHPGRQDNE